MRTIRIPMLACLAILMASGKGIRASADSSSGFTLDASGTASVYAELSYPETPAGDIGNPSFEPWLESDLRLSAESPAALFRLRLERTRRDESSGLDPRDYSDSLGLEVREAEAGGPPSVVIDRRPRRDAAPQFRHRSLWLSGQSLRQGHVPKRLLGAGCRVDSRSRPIDSRHPLGRSHRQNGIAFGSWGPRLGRSRPVLARALDTATGLYASGAGSGELRPIGYVSIPLLSLLASLEAALSVPLSGPDREPWESVRCELRKDMDVGEATLGLGAAYRGIFPGRDEAEIASLIAETAPSDLEYLPFAPFYGRNYVELSIYLEKTNAYSLSADASLAVPWGSVSFEGKAEFYIGDIGLYVQFQGVAGDADGEFNDMALAAGLPGLEVWSGVEISF